MKTPQFVAVLFDGAGELLETAVGETEAEARSGIIPHFTRRQAEWEAGGTAQPPDPPIWQLYKEQRTEATMRWPEGTSTPTAEAPAGPPAEA